MPNAIRSPRRILVLGLVISLGILGFALPRPISKAQEPAKGVDKKALREQIGTLHAEIDLMEVEQGVDRQAIADLIREERGILAEFDSILEGKQKQEMLDELIKDLKSKEKPKFKDDLVEKLGEKFPDEFVDKLVTLSKASKEEFSKERERLVEWFYEKARNKATETVRDKMVSVKKDFTRRSAEIAGKKLDLAILERQYLEAR
jgi:predicted DNA-binding protein YlxM (UPF0122 family)